MIEVEIQNETHQTQQTLRFAAVPRIGEGIRLFEPSGFWVSYDVIDVWYQKAEYGDIWVPFLHVRITPAEQRDVIATRPAPDHVGPYPDDIPNAEGRGPDAEGRGAPSFVN